MKYIHVRNTRHLDVIEILRKFDISFTTYGMSYLNGEMIRVFGIEDDSVEVFTMLRMLLPCEIKNTTAITHS